MSDLKTQIDNGTLKYHHSASRRGYISRKNLEGTIEAYNGVFGEGAIVVTPRFDTTQYVDIAYYVKAS